MKKIAYLRVFVIGLTLLYGCKENTLPPELVYPDDPFIGIGTKEEPYDISSAIRKTKRGTTSWVTGYIVGGVRKGNTEVSDANDIVFGTQDINELTLLLASDVDETDYNIIPPESWTTCIVKKMY